MKSLLPIRKLICLRLKGLRVTILRDPFSSAMLSSSQVERFVPHPARNKSARNKSIEEKHVVN